MNNFNNLYQCLICYKWCLHNGVDDFLADRYCDHALKGLDKNYRRDDLFQQRADLAERYYDFVRGAA